MDAGSVRFGQHEPARRVIVHLSDTHLLAGDVRLTLDTELTSPSFVADAL